MAETLVDPVVGARDGVIHGWNVGAEQVFGYRADEIVGEPLGVLYPSGRLGELEWILARLARGEAIERFESVRRRKDGVLIPVSLSVSPVRGHSGEICGAAIVHDISARRRFEEIQGFLAEASHILGVTLDRGETLSNVASLTLKGLADWCVVETTDADGSSPEVVVAHRDPGKMDIAREMQRLYPAGAVPSTISRRVLATGTSELIPEVSDTLLKNIAHSPEHLRMLRELALQSMIVVPMRARGRVLGTISLGAESGHVFELDDLDLAEDLARRAALSIDNAALYKAEHAARQQAERVTAQIGHIQAVTTALLSAVTPNAVAKVLVRLSAAPLAVDVGSVRLLTPDGLQLRLAASFGTQRQRLQRNVPLSVLSDTEAFHTGAARYFESAAAVRAASPELVRDAYPAHEAVALVPLAIRGRPIGAMTLGFLKPRTFDDRDRELLTAIAAQGAQALERARLLTTERRSRRAAEHASERAERLQRVEREFVANAAHQLRTPLSAIASAVDRLQAGAREDPEKRDRYIGHIHRESGRLNRLTSSLLVLARAQMRVEVPRRDEISLRGLLEELIDDLQVAQGVGIVLECPFDLAVSTNRDLLEHALLNLVDNAARHTERGQIRVNANVVDDGSVIIEVVDTGVGIPTKELGQLFDRFYRGSGEKPNIGFGLGLPITKEAVEAIGGRVEIDSTLAVGTTARILLPGAGTMPTVA